MKLKHKEFIIGIVLGGVVFSVTTIFANNMLNVITNPFKIKVDNVEKFIEGYNINGNSYFKLRDIGRYTGFDVDFKENTIMINTQLSASLNSGDEKTIQTNSKNDVEVINEDTIKVSENLYYYFQFINKNKLKNIIFIPVENSNETYTLNLYDKDTNEILIESVPTLTFCEHMYVGSDYFQDVILPLDK